jgi:hyperosmotically inducible protein
MKKMTLFLLSSSLFLCFFLTTVSAQSRDNLSPMEERIRRSLITLPFYSLFDILSFQIEGDTVTLSGQVTRPSLKSDAEAVVKRVSDVQNVKNEIEVLPLSPNDDRIRQDAYRAIYYHPSFFRYALRAVPPIHIIVKNGDLTLEGVVASEADKNLATIRANLLSGVFSVTNNLVVEGD